MMEDLLEDEFPDMDEIHSKTLFTKPLQARPKKRVLKQWTVFDVESPHQNIINSKLLKRSKSLSSSQTMKDTMFQAAQKPTSAIFNISGQALKSLKEMKENIEDECIASKEACGMQCDVSLKSCRRNIPGLDPYRNTAHESDNNNKKEKYEKVMDQPTQKTSKIPVSINSSHCLINDYTKDIENHFTQDQSCFPDLSNLSPNMCFIDSKTPPTKHNRSFSLANTSFLDLETPSTAADKSTPDKDMEITVTSDSNSLKTPMNFSTVTVSELGISPETFTFKSSEKMKSSLSKYRRRSTIGLRGSPETNCLIRYIARQKLEHPEEPNEMVSPFRTGRHSSLKEKISAFRDSFLSLEEREQNCASTDFLEDGVHHAQNASTKSPFLKPLTVPELHKDPPSKQKNTSIIDQPNTCAVNKTVVNGQLLKSIPRQVSGVPCSRTTNTDLFAGSPVLVPSNVKFSTANLTAKTKGEGNASPAFWKQAFSMGTKPTFTKVLTPEKFDRSYQRSLPFQHGVSPAGVQASPSPFLRPALKKTPTPAKHGKEPHKARVLFSMAEERSSSSDYMDVSVAKSPKLANSRTVILDERGTPDEPKEQKRKRVTFGRALSPEIFDKTLPANTPLRKGRTPDRYSSLSNIKIPVEALPLIQLEPIEQPNFDNAEECDESSQDSFPVSTGDGHFKASEAIAEPDPPSSQVSDTVDCEVISTSNLPEPPLESEPLMQIGESPPEESQDNAVADCNSEEDTHKESTSSEGGRITRSAIKRKYAEHVEKPCLSDSVPPETTNKEDKLVARKNLPQSAKKKPSGKKRTTKVRFGRRKGRGKKSQKVVYGARETVSKKPILSPIFEVPEVLSNTPSVSPAWNLALAAPDSSESSDGSRHPLTDRKVARRKRSARGTGRHHRDSSEDSTCDESESDQVSDSEATSETEGSMNVQGFGTPETSQIPSGDQTVEENGSIPVVPQKRFKDAPGRPSEVVDVSSVSVTLPEVKENDISMGVNMQAEHTSATDEPNSTTESTNAHHVVKELPRNIPIYSAIPCELNINKSQRRQSRRLSLQVLGPRVQAKETTQSLPVSKMKKSRRASCDASTKPDDAFLQTPIVEKNSTVTTILIEATDIGSRGSGYKLDYMFPINAADTTEGKTQKPSKNSRRKTVFSFRSDNVCEGVPAAVDVLVDPPLEDNSVPSCVDVPEDDGRDSSFNIEETFQNVATSDRAVRRSMRLRRSSGVVGLNWINESASETESRTNRKLRRSRVNTPALRENNSPTPKPTPTFSSPGKENCEHPSLLCFSGKPARRRTLCTSTIQKHSNVEVRRTRKGRRSFTADAVCSVNVDHTEHPGENKSKSDI
ncbi:cell division cycle-associated protein 2 isoform X1 [Pleurodeles waltl]|uniref:cell division cycle-associated protein 2 isoform X1 n=1 Tax=Pleurodeles waltl TaxID=8319 RepID=UPI0037094C8B